MERFTEKFKDGRNILRKGIADIFHIGFGRFFEGEAIDKLAEYEQMEEQGLLLRLPCKVGTTVYITDGSSLTVREIHIQDNLVKYFVARFNPNGLDVRFAFDKIGKTVFLTQVEAEKALKKMKGRG